MIINSALETCDKLININNYIRELCDDPIMSSRNNNDDLRIFQRVSCLKGLSNELTYHQGKLLLINEGSNAINIINTILTILDQINKLKLEYINNTLTDNIYFYDYLPSLRSLCNKLNYISLDLRQAISQLNENELTYLLKYAREASISWGNRYIKIDAPSNFYVVAIPFVAYMIAQYILDRPDEQHTTDQTTKATDKQTNKEETKLSILDQKAYYLQQQLHSPLPHNITLETLYTNIPPRTGYDDYRCVLGQGVLCHTYRKQNVIDNMIYAVKVIRDRDVRSNYLNFDTIYTEALALQAISHTNIVRHLVVFKSYNNEVINIVMELVDGSSLAKYTQNTTATTAADRPSKELITKWLLQTLEALQYLHDDMHILHRDIKPDNILITSPQQDVKLIGIDLATIACSSLCNNILCISLYASLEKADNYEYDGRDDVWAVGCVWSELLTGVSLQGRGVILCRPQSAAVLTQVIEECIVCDGTLGAVTARMLVSSDVDRATASECLQLLTDGTCDLSPPPLPLITDLATYTKSYIDPPPPPPVAYSMSIDEGEYGALTDAIAAIDLSSLTDSLVRLPYTAYSMPPIDYSMPSVDFNMPIDELDDCMPPIHFSTVSADEQDYSYLAYDIAAIDLSSSPDLVNSSGSPVGYTYSNPIQLSAADESSSSQYDTESLLATKLPSNDTSSYESVVLPLQAYDPTVSRSFDPNDNPHLSLTQSDDLQLYAQRAMAYSYLTTADHHASSTEKAVPPRSFLPLHERTVSSSSSGPIIGPLISPPVQNQLPRLPIAADKSAVSKQPYRVPPHTISAAVVGSDSRPRRRLIGLDKDSSERSNSSSDSLVADGTEVQTEVEGTESVDMINEQQTDEANVVGSNTVVKSIAQTTSSSADTITATADAVIPVHEMSIAQAEEILIDVYSISNTELWQLRCLNDYLIKLLEVGYGGGKNEWTEMGLVRFFRGEPQLGQGQAPVASESSDSGGSGDDVDLGIGVEGDDKRGKRQVRVRTSPSTPMQGISHISPTRRKEA